MAHPCRQEVDKRIAVLKENQRQALLEHSRCDFCRYRGVGGLMNSAILGKLTELGIDVKEYIGTYLAGSRLSKSMQERLRVFFDDRNILYVTDLYEVDRAEVYELYRRFPDLARNVIEAMELLGFPISEGPLRSTMGIEEFPVALRSALILMGYCNEKHVLAIHDTKALASHGIGDKYSRLIRELQMKHQTAHTQGRCYM